MGSPSPGRTTQGQGRGKQRGGRPVQPGFTLIEVSVVIAIMALLVAATTVSFRKPIHVLSLNEAREQLSNLALLEHRQLLDFGTFLPVPRVPADVSTQSVPLSSAALDQLGFPDVPTATQLEVIVGTDERGPWFRAIARVQHDRLMELSLDSRSPREIQVRAVEHAPP